MKSLPLRFGIVVLASASFLTSCDVAPPASTSAPPPNAAASARPTQDRTDLKQRQAAFLNRIRAADPQQTTIDRALLNEQNELGLILDRRVEMDKIPDLMRTMLTQMTREFPGEDLTVIAYAPSDPPRKIGTARLKARTGDMTYDAEQ
jgi:hypothetical protein